MHNLQLNWFEANGQELTMASTSTSTMLMLSYVNFACPIILYIHLLTEFISCSNMPPHQGASSKLNFHLMPTFARHLVSSGCFIISLRVFATALNASHCLTLIFWAAPSGPAKHSRHLQHEFKIYCTSYRSKQTYPPGRSLLGYTYNQWNSIVYFSIGK